jgi:hypothetical protein
MPTFPAQIYFIIKGTTQRLKTLAAPAKVMAPASACTALPEAWSCSSYYSQDGLGSCHQVSLLYTSASAVAMMCLLV